MRLQNNEQILNHIILKTKKTFQNHAQEKAWHVSDRLYSSAELSPEIRE